MLQTMSECIETACIAGKLYRSENWRKVQICSFPFFPMGVLPSSIESYLRDAGFSPSELLILQRLIQEDAMTVRELASKTGKSIGALDQAIKKLLSKEIISREVINDQPKYTFATLQPIIKWMQEDMRRKQEQMERRHQNFESFVASLKLDKNRPEMNYFEGWDGLKKAYSLLLNTGDLMLEYDPAVYKAEEDPLRDFKVEYFRERRRRRIFPRILAPDTTYGRRFQSSDAFEYRKTVLLPPENFPIHFHKIITKGIVACISYKDQRACFIRYPEFAESERMVFDKLWNDAEVAEKARGELHSQASAKPIAVIVPLKTRLTSALREFFLSKASIPSFILFAVLSAGITLGMYQYTRNLNLQRIRERAISIVATAALQIDSKDLDQLHDSSDIKKPVYKKIIDQLNNIRDQNTDVKYIYILRPIDNINRFVFVADADSIDPNAKKDLNGDGIINSTDDLVAPGDEYISQNSMNAGRDSPAADEKPYTDQWGTFISGAAPIKSIGNKTVAVIGIDIFASKLDELSSKTLIPLYFLSLLVLFLCIRFGAKNKPLLKEVYKVVYLRSGLLTCLILYSLH